MVISFDVIYIYINSLLHLLDVVAVCAAEKSGKWNIVFSL
jgi:hypothetical protein